MALSKLDSLYMAVVADHSRHPHNQGVLEDCQPLVLNNPTCGDVISLTVKMEGDKVADLAFSGSGCTISTASASMMTELVKGKTRDQVLDLAQIFSAMVQGEVDDRQKDLEDAAFLAGVAKFPQRIKCATLAWNAIKKAMEMTDDTNKH